MGLSDFYAHTECSPHPAGDPLPGQRMRLRKGDSLYRVGDRFHALYAIRAGSCKTILLAKDGKEQVGGYHLAGAIVGLDGLDTEFHQCQAIALEDMEAFALSFDQVERIARMSDTFRRDLLQVVAQAVTCAHDLMIVLGTMRAEQRIAAYLLDVSNRYRSMGYSPNEFVLRMTREEIGSYLGIKLETASRLFSRFQREGLIRIDGRAVKLLDSASLSRLVESGRQAIASSADDARSVRRATAATA
jgi:CRP/FNR family transcriptional regulator